MAGVQPCSRCQGTLVLIFAVITRSNILSSLEMLYVPCGTWGVLGWKVGREMGKMDREIIIIYIREMELGFDE